MTWITRILRWPSRAIDRYVRARIEAVCWLFIERHTRDNRLLCDGRHGHVSDVSQIQYNVGRLDARVNDLESDTRALLALRKEVLGCPPPAEWARQSAEITRLDEGHARHWSTIHGICGEIANLRRMREKDQRARRIAEAQNPAPPRKRRA